MTQCPRYGGRRKKAHNLAEVIRDRFVSTREREKKTVKKKGL